MHILSDRHRSEFLVVPELVRVTMARGTVALEPTLLVKTLTLSLKYLIRSNILQLVFFRLSGKYLAYALQLDDDPEHAGTVWSVMETEDERRALRSMLMATPTFVFLYNELAVNVAQSEITVCQRQADVGQWVQQSILGRSEDRSVREEMSAKLDAYRGGYHREDMCILPPVKVKPWEEIRNTYVTNRISHSSISAFEPDEGGQQEEAALWLIDQLQPQGAAKNPIVHQETKSRELCDLMLSHSYGAFLFESKALSILSRKHLPTRKKLATHLSKHVLKAEKQLAGGLRSLRRNCRITDSMGRDLVVERQALAHAITVVPDLMLLSDANSIGGGFLKNFVSKTGCFLQILDLKELLRMVQAAEMLQEQGTTVSRMMCFDAQLTERFKCAIDHETPDFGFLLRFGTTERT